MSKFLQSALLAGAATFALAAPAVAQTTTTTTTVERPDATTTTTVEKREPVRLTPQQRTIISRTITRTRPVTTTEHVQVRVGERVPSSVQLYDLPQEVYVQEPALKHYKYFYINHQAVLVDLDTNQIVDILK